MRLPAPMLLVIMLALGILLIAWGISLFRYVWMQFKNDLDIDVTDPLTGFVFGCVSVLLGLMLIVPPIWGFLMLFGQ